MSKMNPNTRLQITNFGEKLQGIQIVSAGGLLFVLKADGTIESYKNSGKDAAFERSGEAERVLNKIKEEGYGTPKIMELARYYSHLFLFRVETGFVFLFTFVEGKLTYAGAKKDIARITNHVMYKLKGSYIKSGNKSGPMIPLLESPKYRHKHILSVFETPFGDAFTYIKENNTVALLLPSGPGYVNNVHDTTGSIFEDAKSLDVNYKDSDVVVGLLCDLNKEYYVVKSTILGYEMFKLDMVGDTPTEIPNAIGIKDWGYLVFETKPIVFNYIRKITENPQTDDYIVPRPYPHTQFEYLKSHGKVRKVSWAGIGATLGAIIPTLPDFELIYTPKKHTKGFKKIVPYYVDDGGDLKFLGTDLNVASLDGTSLIDHLYNNDCSKTLNVNSMSAMSFESYNLGGFIMNYSGAREAEITDSDWQNL